MGGPRPTSPCTSSRGWSGVATSRPSRRSCATTGGGHTGESATPGPPRTWRRSTRGGMPSSAPAPSSTPPAPSETPTPTGCWAEARESGAGREAAPGGRRSEKGPTVAAVGRDLVDDPIAGDEIERLEALAELARLRVAHIDAV